MDAQAGRARARQAARAPAAPEAVQRAQATLYRALYAAVGETGSLLESQAERSFALDPAYGAGHVCQDHRVAVPLPQGATWHTHALAAVVEHTWLGVDIVGATDPLRLRAHAFDTVHLRGRDGPALMLVLVRQPGGVTRDEADAVAYAYDHVFGVDEDRVGEQRAFAAFRSEFRDRLLAL